MRNFDTNPRAYKCWWITPPPPPLVLCLFVAGRLVCLYDPQSCAGGSLLLLASLTI